MVRRLWARRTWPRFGRRLRKRDRFFCLRRWLLLFSLASAIAPTGAGVAPVRGGSHFLCRCKESNQRKRAHTANPFFTHVPPTSPYFARQRAGVGSLPTYPIVASPASCIRRIANGIERFRPHCGKLCVGCRTTQGSAYVLLAHCLVSRRFSCAVRRPTHSLPHRAQ